MSVIKRNIVKLEQVAWKFKISVGSNKVTASGAYEDDYPGWMSRMPSMNSAHPDIPVLKLKDLAADRQPGDRILVTLDYESNDPDAEYPGREKGKIKRYHFEPSAGEEPLLTNIKFKDFTDAEKESALELLASSKAAADFEKAKSVLTSSAGEKFLEKVRKGIDAYRSPGLIWVERFTTKNLDDASLTKLLKTTSEPPGPCPSAGSDRNWLRLMPMVNPHDDGETFDLENRWELSLPGKWDPDLYPSGG